MTAEDDARAAELARAMKIHPVSLAEATVWREITRGGLNQQIADHLYLSHHTVKTQTAALFRHLPLRRSSRTAAAIYALRRGVFHLAPWGPDQLKRPLSERETQTCVLLAEGLSNAEIGEELDISPLTVKSHLARIAEAVGTGNRTMIATRLYRAGVIK